MSDKMIREGAEAGYPTTAFDAEKRLPYHLDAKGQRVYHGVPEGYSFKADGTLSPKRGVEVPQVVAPDVPDEPPAK